MDTLTEPTTDPTMDRIDRCITRLDEMVQALEAVRAHLAEAERTLTEATTPTVPRVPAPAPRPRMAPETWFLWALALVLSGASVMGALHLT